MQKLLKVNIVITCVFPVEAGQSDEDSSGVADANALKVMTPEVAGHAEVGANTDLAQDDGGAYPVSMYAVGNAASTATGKFVKDWNIFMQMAQCLSACF